MHSFNVTLILIINASIIIILLFVCFKEKLTQRKQKDRIQNLYLYNETLIDMYDGIQTLKHDLMNFVQSLNGYVKCEDMAGIRKMTNSLAEECLEIHYQEKLTPENVNDPAVYQLFISKFKEASLHQILMNVDGQLDFKTIAIDVFSLCRILGILLDNAIEAANECEEKIVNVKLISHPHKDVICVENSYQNSTIDVVQIFEKGFSTKGHSEKHGLGLWTVKNIVAKNEKLKLETIKGHLFKQILSIDRT